MVRRMREDDERVRKRGEDDQHGIVVVDDDGRCR